MLNTNRDIVCSLQWIGGFVSFLYPVLSAPLRVVIMPFHVIYISVSSFIYYIKNSISNIDLDFLWVDWICFGRGRRINGIVRKSILCIGVIQAFMI